MSVFTKSFKTITSDITGEEKEYKVNNYVWLYLQTKHDLTQLDWVNGLDDNNALYGAYFVTGVLKGNGLKVTLNEVLENTRTSEILDFVRRYQDRNLDLGIFDDNGELIIDDAEDTPEGE